MCIGYTILQEGGISSPRRTAYGFPHPPSTALPPCHSSGPTGALGWPYLPASLIHSSFPGRAAMALQFTPYPSERLSSRLWMELARIKSNYFLKFISNFQCFLCHRINISPAGGLACLFFFPLQISFFLSLFLN